MVSILDAIGFVLVASLLFAPAVYLIGYVIYKIVERGLGRDRPYSETITPPAMRTTLVRAPESAEPRDRRAA